MDRLKRFAAVALVTAISTTTGSGIFLAAPAYGQDAVQAAPADYVPLDMDALEQVVAPIALYPDAFLAQVLVACTYPDDVTAASQWLAAGNDPQGIDNQNWDLSIKGVARDPDVLNYLAGNPDLMNNLGAAYINQPADVMAAIQNLRAQAQAAGNLVSCDQAQVIDDDGCIEIIPTDPDEICVPAYDSSVVCLPEQLEAGQVYVPLIRWGRGIRVGPWLHHDIDWHDHQIYVGNFGPDRPWWHLTAGRDDYAQVRPGAFVKGTIATGRRGSNISGAAWTRDPHKALPRAALRPANRANPAPNRGYATPPRGEVRPRAPGDYDRGSAVNRASARGRESAESAHPEERAREAPARESEPQRAPAPPTARPSAPVKGGAMGGYGNEASVARSSSRGAASTGSRSAAPSPAPARSSPSGGAPTPHR